MATAEELGGRRFPATPEPKADETVTFVGPDGNTIEVVKNISKAALAILKKRGFRSATRAQKEEEEAALAKQQLRDTTNSQDDDTVGDEAEEPAQPRRKRAARS